LSNDPWLTQTAKDGVVSYRLIRILARKRRGLDWRGETINRVMLAQLDEQVKALKRDARRLANAEERPPPIRSVLSERDGRNGDQFFYALSPGYDQSKSDPSPRIISHSLCRFLSHRSNRRPLRPRCLKRNGGGRKIKSPPCPDQFADTAMASGERAGGFLMGLEGVSSMRKGGFAFWHISAC